MPEVVTLGEPLIQFNAVSTGPIRHVVYFEKHVAGAEANVAVGAVRMGLSSGLIARVGKDEFGRSIVMTLRGEGVDVSQIELDQKAPTGVYFIQRGYPTPGKSVMFYYRTGSAGSRLCPDDVDPSYIGKAKLLHFTGITPALSSTCREACEKALDIACRAGVKVSFDTNIRLKLWGSEEAKSTLMPMIPKTAILFTDPEDSSILIGERNPARAAKKFLEKGPSIVVIKLGSAGSIAFSGKRAFRQRTYKVPIVDPIGAGDAFAAVFLSCILKGSSIKKSLRAGSVAGALVASRRGDQENIPSTQDIGEFLAGVKNTE